MWPSLKPTQRANVVAAINPQSATTAQTTAWVPASVFNNYLATIQTGALASGGTVDAKIQQATSATGTGAKDIAGKAITQLTFAAGNSNVQANINLKQDELDVNGGFNYIALVVTPAGAAALISATLTGWDPVYGPAETVAATSVVQNIA